MTNKEKYLDEIINAFIPFIAVIDGRITHCGQGLLRKNQCSHCLFNSKRGEIDPQCCADIKREWFNREYTPNDFHIDWSKVAVDTPILVTEYGGGDPSLYIIRYFAKYANNKVWTWRDGRTSLTAGPKDITSWKYARLYEKRG